MEDVKFAVWLDNPEWQDRNGNVCDQKNAADCRVTHDRTHPETCIVMEEVVSNTSQKDDGHIGGKLLVCAEGMVPHQKVSTKDKHWTLPGFTTLNGYSVMCVLILTSKQMNPLYEYGMGL